MTFQSHNYDFFLKIASLYLTVMSLHLAVLFFAIELKKSICDFLSHKLDFQLWKKDFCDMDKNTITIFWSILQLFLTHLSVSFFGSQIFDNCTIWTSLTFALLQFRIEKRYNCERIKSEVFFCCFRLERCRWVGYEAQQISVFSDIVIWCQLNIYTD